ncbi:membrane protein insertase YidC [Caldimonas tepidiphila]|uniref:membrane protein insertase YidC n=1 Tax=Caldimonas tepidiphila TaxID=2315841 RepID=UPI000E5A837C|nr:membrane protein insertase YidC [Caldimonas tepidiphila]
MTDMRRTILWLVFTMSLVLLWDAWNKHTGRPTMFSPAPAVSGAQAPGAAPQAQLPAPATTGGAAVPTPPPATVAAEKVAITTDVVQATIDAKGADLIRLELLKHADEHDPKRPVVLMQRDGQRFYVAQSGLINRVDAGPAFPNHTTLMTPMPGPRTLEPGQDSLQVRFESPEIGGLKYAKTYVFKRGSYAVEVKHEVTNTGEQPATPQLYLQIERDGYAESGNYMMGTSTFTGPAIYSETSKFQKIDFGDLDKGGVAVPPAGTQGWVAMVQHYFVSAWLKTDSAQREFRVTKNPQTGRYTVAMVLPMEQLAPGQTRAVDTTLYSGPQEEKRLEALAPGLELVKDYGMFTIISKPLFWLLDKLHGFIGNWGWAIVALVVLLKAAFYGLNASAYRSMAKMKAVGPKLQELRERHKDNPQQMQQEMMRIYREEKVNPLGGCLPILIQMPVFIALYWVLLSSVEMRNAPWVGWITDLSAKDPYFILPVVMTLTTLFQTWLNPTPPDPMQARMMWIMPLVFSVMFFFFPAGLVLYWITNNILSIAQQWYINRKLGLNK